MHYQASDLITGRVIVAYGLKASPPPQTCLFFTTELLVILTAAGEAKIDYLSKKMTFGQCCTSVQN